MDHEKPEAVYPQVTVRERGARQASSDASDTIYAVTPDIEDVEPVVDHWEDVHSGERLWYVRSVSKALRNIIDICLGEF
jgi:hypothetical protein